MSHLGERWLAARISGSWFCTDDKSAKKSIRDFATDEKMRGIVHAQIDFRIRLPSQSPSVVDAKALYYDPGELQPCILHVLIGA